MMKKAGAGLPMQDNDEQAFLEPTNCTESRNQKISETWMYDWMDELMDLDHWKKSVKIDEDLSHVFAFRESKIYILKRVREKLHRLQTTMVRLLSIPSDTSIGFGPEKLTECFLQPVWRMLDAIQVQCR
jgi:hypothetical protein